MRINSGKLLKVQLLKKLDELSQNARTISFIGKDKGSGKTTALGAFMEACRDRTLGITSVGVDGLRVGDNGSIAIAGSAEDDPKGCANKGLFVKEGSVIASARALLPLMDVTKEILEVSNINSPIGEIVIFSARSAGNVVVAGPSSVRDLIMLRDSLLDFGAELVLVDGAVNRKSLALTGESDYTVYTICLKDLHSDKVLEDILEDLDRLLIPQMNEPLIMDLEKNSSIVYLDLNLGNIHNYLEAEAKDIDIEALYIQGAITTNVIKEFAALTKVEKKRLNGAKLIFEDGTKIIAKTKDLKIFGAMGISIFAKNKINIMAICVNPFMSKLNEDEISNLIIEIHRKTNIPVFDIKGGTYSC